MANTLGPASLIFQIGGAVNSAVGSYFDAENKATQLKYEGYISALNAKLAEMGAQSALNQGQQQTAAVTLRAGQIAGAQRASMAANGIDIGEGTAADVQASTELMKQADQNTILSNAVRSSILYRTREVSDQNNALFANAAGNSINPAGNAFSTLLGGAGQVASSWYQLNRLGALN